MHELAVFSPAANKRLYDLQQCSERECPEASHARLKKHCDTRWVEKQAALQLFKEPYHATVASLDNILEWLGDASGKAAMYLRCMNPSFLFSLEVLQTVLEVTKPLSVKLQGVSQDILRSTESVRDCVDLLQNFRSGDMFD